MNVESLVRNLIQVGQVNSVDPETGTVTVIRPDKDNAITDNIPLLNFEYNMPSVGDQVVCIFLGNGLEQGFCLGSFYSNVSPPPVTDQHVYRKQLDDDAYIEYSKSSKVLTVQSGGTVTVDADSVLIGSSGAGESVPLGDQLKSWLDSHTHSNSGAGSPSSSSPAPSQKVKVE